MKTNIDQRARLLAGLWAISGIILIAAALIFSEILMNLVLGPWGGPLDRTLERIPGVRLRLGIVGALLLGGALLLPKTGLLRWLGRTDRRANLVLLITSVLVFVFALEQVLSARFYREPKRETTLFLRDDALGWRLRPNTRNIWGEVPVSINSLGFRGPELPPHGGPDQFRILFLGDSVTFGYRVEDGQPFPAMLTSEADPWIDGRRLVSINAGVGGYSPWQELGLLERFGLELDPDLVVVCFVLNDVTEKFSLVQFGGDELGFQIRHTVEGLGDRLAGWSSIFSCGCYLRDRLRFGARPGESAREMERLQVMDLLYDEKKPLIDEAWRLTLENLNRIFTLCDTEGIDSILVVFPYAFQLENPAMYGRPQRILTRFAEAHGIETIDLLPLLRSELDGNGLSIAAYFIDDNHLTPGGHEAVASILRREIGRRQTTLPAISESMKLP